MDRYFHPDLRKHVDTYSCDTCQRHKVGWTRCRPLGTTYTVRAAPWEQVDVDLIGPWTVPVKTGSLFEFLVLTCIDRVTGLAEFIRISDNDIDACGSKVRLVLAVRNTPGP